MSVSYGFYDSINNDRSYSADQFLSIFDGVFEDGVLPNFGDRLYVTANGGMTLHVGSGRAWFKHTWTYNDAALPLTLSPPSYIYSRIDAVVLEINKTTSVRENQIKVISGNESASPSKPVLLHNESVDQYAIAYITVPSGSSEVIQNNIENVVGTSETPYAGAVGFDRDALLSEVISEINQNPDSILNNVYPVGSVYISINNVSPHDLFGGVWESLPGRFLVGAGASIDISKNTRSFSGGEANGEYQHLLSTKELPAHTHDGTSSEYVHSHQYEDETFDYFQYVNEFKWHDSNYGVKYADVTRDNRDTDPAGSHSHNLTLGNTGGSQPHNNMPPYLVVYMWKRVA